MKNKTLMDRLRPQKKANTLNPSGIRLWRPPLGDSRRLRLSRQMDEFLVFIIIFEQNVAKLTSLWRSAPAKPRQHVGHGAQARPKQWVNFGD